MNTYIAVRQAAAKSASTCCGDNFLDAVFSDTTTLGLLRPQLALVAPSFPLSDDSTNSRIAILDGWEVPRSLKYTQRSSRRVQFPHFGCPSSRLSTQEGEKKKI